MSTNQMFMFNNKRSTQFVLTEYTKCKAGDFSITSFKQNMEYYLKKFEKINSKIRLGYIFQKLHEHRI